MRSVVKAVCSTLKDRSPPALWLAPGQAVTLLKTLSKNTQRRELLGGSGLLVGLSKYSGSAVRRRGSIPKLQVLNTALLTAQSAVAFDEVHSDPDFRGRLVESAVGAHLANAAAAGQCEVFYWLERNQEVDFVVKAGRRLVAIEVKSGRRRGTGSGLAAFTAKYKPARTLLAGGEGIPLDEFLLEPVTHWIAA